MPEQAVEWLVQPRSLICDIDVNGATKRRFQRMRSLILALASVFVLLLTGPGAVQAERVEVDDSGNVHYLDGAKRGGGSTARKTSGGKKRGATVAKAGKSSSAKTVATSSTKPKTSSTATKPAGQSSSKSSSAAAK